MGRRCNQRSATTKTRIPLTGSGLFFSSVLNCQVTPKQFNKSLRPRFLSTMPLASLTSCILVRLWANLKSRQEVLEPKMRAACRVESQQLIRCSRSISGWYVVVYLVFVGLDDMSLNVTI